MKFIVCGLTGFIIETSILTLLVELTHLDPRIAKLPAGLVSVTFVYFFNKYVTFGNKERSASQTARFVMVYTSAFALNYLVFALLVHVGMQYLMAQVVTVGSIAVLNYILSHGFIFRKEESR